MSNTKIEWTDDTWSPVTGCTKVSRGCTNCYAEKMFARLSKNPMAEVYHGREFKDVMCHPERLGQPMKWTRKPRRVFVNSMSDLFHEDVPDEFIDQVFAVMALCPQHTFQVLTKRAERMREYMSHSNLSGRIFAASLGVRGEMGMFLEEHSCLPSPPLPNVWLGVSVEDQPTADARIPELLATPSAVRFLSYEPALSGVDLSFTCQFEHEENEGYGVPAISGLDWVICGGESGPNARPMHPDWARSVRDQCVTAGVSFFFKQWGTKTKRKAGRTLDGRTWDEYPDSVREVIQ